MPGCTDEALHNFQHPHPKRLQNTPHAWTQPVYGAKVQYAENLNNYPAIPPNTVHLVQQIVGNLLYYDIAVDITMLIALSSIAAT